MRELDIMLMRFFDNNFDQLDQQQQRQFESLLATQDPVLVQWLFGRQLPEEPTFVDLVRRIRDTSHA